MVTDFERQAIVDEEHLRLLPVFYWVQGAIGALYAPIALIYVVIGVGIAYTPSSGDAAPPAMFGWVFAAIGGLVFAVLAAGAVLTILTGFWIRKRWHRAVCLVMAGLSCLFVPYGTMLGVFTFLVLLRPSVKALFEAAPVGQTPYPPMSPEVYEAPGPVV